jgi:hypothetical protein
MTQPGQNETRLSMTSDEMESEGQMRPGRSIHPKLGSSLWLSECKCRTRDDFKSAASCRDGAIRGLVAAFVDEREKDLKQTPPACTARHTTSANAG